MDKNKVQIEFGQRVRQIRAAKGVTQETMAKRIRISRANMVNIEQGRIGVDLWRLAQIAAALQTTPDALLSERWRELHEIHVEYEVGQGRWKGTNPKTA